MGSPREGHAAIVLGITPTAVLLPGQIAFSGAPEDLRTARRQAGAGGLRPRVA
ncbi:hypothetical protein [Gaiella sp.]|uniref:hypothetical protein n=1 Tax=Gaiella sp. TaxID=2663207 RepID=UPI0039834358